MSTERLSFALNSLIPETYKSKAEAFAKCLQHKLLSLGRVDPSREPPSGQPTRLNDRQECGAGAPTPTPDADDPPKKTDDSEEEFCSHSGPENGRSGGRIRKLTSMSSDDSTLDSWGSCQETLADLDKLDSEPEEVSPLAAQVRGSPKLRSFNMRAKRKELREKTWKRNSRRNHSSSTESLDSEGVKEGLGHPGDDLDRELGSHCILLDGLEPEDEDVPHRVLRESASTGSLERQLSREDGPRGAPPRGGEARGERAGRDFPTPPPSPDDLQRVAVPPRDDLSCRLQFAQIETDSGEVEFVEVECLKAPCLDELSRPVHKIGGVIVECARDENSGVGERGESFVVTSVEVLQDAEEDRQKDIDSAEDEDILDARSRTRRCSSLKTWKTPPGTPGCKKIVRFADALGLDLADVRTFLDDIPKVPTSAYDDLHFDLPQPDHPPTLTPAPASALVPLFPQPGAHLDFLDRVRTQKICLETTVVTLDGVATVTGFVRVQNLAFDKSVHVRYTLDNWATFSDLQATYVPHSCDGFSDRFTFALYGHTLGVGEKLEFALRLECCGGQFWDNNGGSNYVFHCLPRTSASGFFSSLCSSEAADPWFDFY